jgi:hypothetical protein
MGAAYFLRERLDIATRKLGRNAGLARIAKLGSEGLMIDHGWPFSPDNE